MDAKEIEAVQNGVVGIGVDDFVNKIKDRVSIINITKEGE